MYVQGERERPFNLQPTESALSRFDTGLINMPPSEEGHRYKVAQEEIVV
jgi:hypothetical protein